MTRTKLVAMSWFFAVFFLGIVLNDSLLTGAMALGIVGAGMNMLALALNGDSMPAITLAPGIRQEKHGKRWHGYEPGKTRMWWLCDWIVKEEKDGITASSPGDYMIWFSLGGLLYYTIKSAGHLLHLWGLLHG